MVLFHHLASSFPNKRVRLAIRQKQQMPRAERRRTNFWESRRRKLCSAQEMRALSRRVKQQKDQNQHRSGVCKYTHPSADAINAPARNFVIN
jgi:hypothetical protein